LVARQLRRRVTEKRHERILISRRCNMNTTQRTILLLFVPALLLTVGCAPKVASRGAAEDKPAPLAAPAPAERANFPGGSLFVTIDEQTSREAKKENNEQIWTCGEISSTPTILFNVDENSLGPVKSVSLVIQPVQNGKVIQGDLYQYTGSGKLAPGQGIKLDAFTHVKDNQLQSGIKSLPAGTYRFGLQVHGQKNWDRQSINVTVK
jgi:hypothetical protein